MSATNMLPRKWKLTTALYTSMIISSMCLFSSSGDSASLESIIQNDINSIESQVNAAVQNDINAALGGSKGGSTKDTDPADAFATKSPIKHVIVLIGENRGLDHTFGVYKPKGAGQTISNLLSKGIVNEDGTPGPNFAQAQQYSVAAQSSYYIGAPAISKSAYNPTNIMPQPNTNGAPVAQSDTGAPFKTVAEASVEKDIDPASLDILTTGFTGLPSNSLDTRVPGAG